LAEFPLNWPSTTTPAAGYDAGSGEQAEETLGLEVTGADEGVVVGLLEGTLEGVELGIAVGETEGVEVTGLDEGFWVGSVGDLVGAVGLLVFPATVGVTVGNLVGITVIGEIV
jgi:hypothetical protein